MKPPPIDIEKLQAESRARRKQQPNPKPIIIKKVVEKIKVVRKPAKPVKPPMFIDKDVIRFIEKVMHLVRIIDVILDRIAEDQARAKVAERIKTPKPAKKLKFNPKANTKMVDWDKLSHF